MATSNTVTEPHFTMVVSFSSIGNLVPADSGFAAQAIAGRDLAGPSRKGLPASDCNATGVAEGRSENLLRPGHMFCTPARLERLAPRCCYRSLRKRRLRLQCT